MDTILREARADDAEAAGRICVDAFTRLNRAHNVPPDFPGPDAGIGLLLMMIAHPGFYVVVAERDGAIIGSNAMDERSAVFGIGPISVSPDAQDRGLGRRLMTHV